MEPLLGNTKDAMESESVYTKQQRIAELGHVLAMLKRRVCEPEPVICHQGSIANPSHEEPYALIALVRVCGGVGGKPPILPGRLRVRSVKLRVRSFRSGTPLYSTALRRYYRRALYEVEHSSSINLKGG